MHKPWLAPSQGAAFKRSDGRDACRRAGTVGRAAALGAVALAAATSGALAQNTGGAQNNSQSGSQNNSGSMVGPSLVRRPVSKYLLGPQDVISVTVERFPAYSSESVMVPPDGKVTLPFFGTLQANGKTTAQLEREMTARIATRIRNPIVRVGLRSLRSAGIGYVYVTGAVRNQGAVEIMENFRLTEILSKVGGVDGRLDEVRASLSRAGRLLPVDLYEAVSRPQGPANIRVRPDDTLTVQVVDPGRIAINGDVVRPGVYELRRAPASGSSQLPLRPRLLDVVVATGGFTDRPENGRVSGFVQRGRQKLPLRVEDAVTFKDTSANIALQAGDFVTFKVELPLSINVLGQVRSPGNHRVAPGGGVLQAIAMAGGLTREPTQTVVTLQRNGLSRPIDLGRLLAGDESENIPLQAEDTIQLNPPSSIKVAVTGAVSSPSTGTSYDMPLRSTVYDAIANAGSLKIPAESARITIVRRTEDGTQKFLSVDAVGLLERRDPSQNARLQDGDIVSVVEAKTQSVTISGEVGRSGAFDIKEDEVEISDIIARAGGHKPTAALRRVSIRSADGTTKTVDAYDSVVNGKPLSVKLVSGDYIVIPENLSRVMVLEAVNRPGPVTLPEGRPMTLLEAISQAGGTRPGARTQEIALLRMGPDGKVAKPLILPINDVRSGKLAAAQQPLQSGDVVVVPEAKATRNILAQAGQVLSVFSLVNAVRGF